MRGGGTRLACAALVLVSACGSAAPVTTPHDLDGAIAALRGAARLDRAAVEGTFGTRLATKDGNSAFALYKIGRAHV